MSKVKRFIFPVLMILAIFSLNLTPDSNVTAQTDDTQSIVEVTGDEADKFVDTTLNAIEEGEVENIAPVSSFDLEESSVNNVGGGVTIVTIAVHKDYSHPSNVTVYLDEDKTVLQTNEMLVTKNEVGNFQVETYMDGSLVNSEDTEISYMTDQELLAEESVDSEIQPMGVGAVAGCLGTVLGVGGTTAYIIAVACGASCAAPTPVTAPICASCIGAYALLGAGGIAGSVACFNYL